MVTLGQEVEAADPTWRCTVGTPPLQLQELQGLYNLGTLTFLKSVQANKIACYCLCRIDANSQNTQGRIGWIVYDPQRMNRVPELVDEILARTAAMHGAANKACWGTCSNPATLSRLAAVGYSTQGSYVWHPSGLRPSPPLPPL